MVPRDTTASNSDCTASPWARPRPNHGRAAANGVDLRPPTLLARPGGAGASRDRHRHHRLWQDHHPWSTHGRGDDGRLVGHGGVPVWARSASKPVPDGVEYVSTRGFRSGIERFALFGFAVLDFDGPRIHVRYIDEHGEPEWTEVLE